MADRRCKTGKVGYASERDADSGARRLARHLNQDGIIAKPLFTYRCDKCRRLHLTRMPSYYGTRLRLAFQPVAEDVQLWAMTTEQRAAIEAERAADQKQSYANRPRGLRR